jgi:hypothetical protein
MNGWNFERRRDTCARFLMGTAHIALGGADKLTNLEAVRNRVRLTPEEALFAARRLHEEQLIVFEPGGAVRSTASGIAKSAKLTSALRAQLSNHAHVLRVLRDGGTPLLVVASLLRIEGAPLHCGAPEGDPEVAYQLALTGDEVCLEKAVDPNTLPR